MEVTYTSKGPSDENYQMLCTQLQTKTIAFNNNDYKE